MAAALSENTATTPAKNTVNATSNSKIKNDSLVAEDEEDDNDSSDEDYNPDNDDNDNISGNDDEDDDEEYKESASAKKNQKTVSSPADDEIKETLKEIKRANYSKIESSEGGLIKTRTQRLREAAQSKDHETLKVLTETQPTTVDIDSIWKEMKTTGAQKRDSSASASASPSLEQQPQQHHNEQQKGQVSTPAEQIEEEKIKITRKYEYAGETIVENKWVLKSSAEAKAYLNSLKIQHKNGDKTQSQHGPVQSITQGSETSTIKPVPSGPKPLKRRRAKKTSIVDDIIKNSKMAKINTLEKSRLDWANYVDNNKLNDELKKHNKDGYLSKQDFLHKVEANIDSKIKETKKMH